MRRRVAACQATFHPKRITRTGPRRARATLVAAVTWNPQALRGGGNRPGGTKQPGNRHAPKRLFGYNVNVIQFSV